MTRRAALWVLGLTMLGLLVVLGWLDLLMSDTDGPGIIGFELARSEERAEEILDDWGEKGQDAARLSLWLDYPYLVVYGAFWTLAGLATRDLAARRGWTGLAAAGAIVALFPIGAAVLDAIENAGLLVALDRRGGDTAPLVAAIAATGKFALLSAGVLYVLAGLARRGWERAGRTSPRSP